MASLVVSSTIDMIKFAVNVNWHHHFLLLSTYNKSKLNCPSALISVSSMLPDFILFKALEYIYIYIYI